MRRLPGEREWDLVYSSIRQDLKSADVVISVGGDNYTDDYGFNSLKAYLLLNKFIKRRNKKLVIWGALVGPFKIRVSFRL